jgi:flagellar biosynthesis component FlhA
MIRVDITKGTMKTEKHGEKISARKFAALVGAILIIVVILIPLPALVLDIFITINLIRI